jgi:hypothetical protein
LALPEKPWDPTAVAARSAYPILRTIQFLLMEFSTITYYLCVNFMKVNIYSKLLYGEVVTSNKVAFFLALGYYLGPLPFCFGLKFLLAALRKDDEETKKEDAKKD